MSKNMSKEVKVYGDGKRAPEILITRDYSIFKRMEGNREVTADRARRICRSIEQIGYVPAPIIVNEFYEIVDGQGRFEALKQLCLPVFFIIVPGLGLKDCVSMNVNSTPWGVIDYIKSFAEIGNENYVRLLKLIDSYDDLPLSVVLGAASPTISASISVIKNGLFECDEELYHKADNMLAYIERFNDTFEDHGITNRAPVMQALCFCYACENVDNERLFDQFTKYCYKLTGSTKIVEILDPITQIYNFKRSKNKVYITTEYNEFLDGKLPWYASYWGARNYNNQTEAS